MIVIVDYGMGNVGSILNILTKLGATATLSTGPEDVLHAERLVLPGVGAFDTAMQNLRRMGYLEALNRKVLHDQTPILGICLGMQLFSQRSEEGSERGLGWLDAETVRFRFPAGAEQLKTPHMGWNTVRVHKATPLFPDAAKPQRFYFVHSFHLRCNAPEDVLTSSHYGLDFVSAVYRGNILGTQFHPEKSHRFGLEFFRAFLEWTPPVGR